MRVAEGEFVAIMGANGSGKTTLLNLIGGLERPSGGRLEVAGLPLHSLSEAELAKYRLERVGFAYQLFNLMPSLRVVENVALPLIIANKGRSLALAQARDTLALLDIGQLANEYPSALSGGELQRVAIARALVHQPELLLADEPTGSLGSLEAETLLEMFMRLRRERKLTLLMVTHHARIAAYADRVLTLKHGHLSGKARGGIHA